MYKSWFAGIVDHKIVFSRDLEIKRLRNTDIDDNTTVKPGYNYHGYNDLKVIHLHRPVESLNCVYLTASQKMNIFSKVGQSTVRGPNTATESFCSAQMRFADFNYF